MRGEPRASRDAAWIEREYGREKWPAVQERINATLETGDRSLSRLISTVARWEWGSPGLQPVTAIALGERVQLPSSLAWHGFYAMVAEAVIATCRDETQAIVDLGCGWGRSLFEVWLRGGPRSATYHGLEFTQAGLDCVATLAKLEPGMAVRTARFDFQRPDFASLAPGLKHAVVFTVSSVHQIPLLDKDAVRSILRIADTVDCLHFEQIGWQLAPPEQSVADRDYALRNDYNRNLWAVLKEMSDAGEITLVNVTVDMFGAQTLYPMSLVHWRRSRN